MQENQHYDAIIIGSGIGGLTTAVFLSKVYKQKVLVLEKHFVAGGQTHDFIRTHNGKKYRWDVGVHYIGEMKKNLFSRKLFDFLTDNKLKWQKMPYYFEKFVYPDFSFKQASNPKDFQKDLIQKFPDEEVAILQYFKDVKNAPKWYQSKISKSFMPTVVSKLSNLFSKNYEHLALQTTQEYMDAHFKNDQLKALLTSTWGDYGLPPEKSAFVIHCLVVRSYLFGGYFPVGGAGEIAKNMIPIIEKQGGKVLTGVSVTEIIIEKGKAKGVKTLKSEKETNIYSDVIISDTGAYNTYIKLIPEDIPIPFRDEIKEATGNLSSMTLHIGFKENPKKLGVEGENIWIFSSYNHNQVYRDSMKQEKIRSAFVSFPSLKDKNATNHTAEIIAFTNYDLYQKWKDSTWLKRDESYKKHKEALIKELLDFTEKQIPGFKNIVDFADLATPLTMEFFTNWEKGSFYGIPPTPDRFKYKWIGSKTPIKNLYLTGTDAGTLGVLGALMGGFFTTASIKGIKGMMKLMKAIKTS